jgi:hypothetical protein
MIDENKECDKDYEEEEYTFDESQMRGRAICRACKEIKFDVLADNGYCSDCD